MLLNNQILTRLVGQIDRLPHAVLFHGPQGVGKLALAERLAHRLLCEAPGIRVDPCGKCDGCRWFLGANHPDACLIEPETRAFEELKGEQGSKTGFLRASREAAKTRFEEEHKERKPSAEIRIDQIRELADFLYVVSRRDGRRIVILHPAEDMNAVASNALLKALEEPPPGAMFLLVSHRPARLLPTIRSRCVAVPVPSPARETARQWLEAQGVGDAERWLAFAGGAPRRAFELAAGEQGACIEPILRALASGDSATLLGLGSREEIEFLVDALQKQALDCALIARGLAPKYGLGTATQAGKISAARWLAYARALGRARALARHPLNPRLFAAEQLAARP